MGEYVGHTRSYTQRTRHVVSTISVQPSTPHVLLKFGLGVVWTIFHGMVSLALVGHLNWTFGLGKHYWALGWGPCEGIGPNLKLGHILGLVEVFIFLGQGLGRVHFGTRVCEG